MTQNDGQVERQFAAPKVYVGSADSGHGDANANCGGFELGRERKLAQGERLLEGFEHGGPGILAQRRPLRRQ
jgi:hypothetical protein